jgi:tagatose 6-phosphate kinase
MILCVTPNSSLDVTLAATGAALEEHAEVTWLAETAGGKGHNVARFLASLGHNTVAAGLAGGWTGQRVTQLLTASSVSPRLTETASRTRLFISVKDAAAGGDRSYHMPGPAATAGERDSLLRTVASLSEDADTVVIAGSFPEGTPAAYVTEMVRAAGRERTVADTRGDWLSAALRARPSMIRVNARELAAIGDCGPRPSPTSLAGLLAALAERYDVPSWWITMGREGAMGWDDGHCVLARPPDVTVRNITGAGDAFTAGLLDARIRGADLATMAADACGFAAAACEMPAAIPPAAGRAAQLATRVRVSRPGGSRPKTRDIR